MSAAPVYCEYCDSYPCDCDTQDVNPRFASNIIDPEDQRGFNPVAWAKAVRAKGALRVDSSGVTWRYTDHGAWIPDKGVVSLRLPLIMGKLYRRPKHLGTVTDRIIAELYEEDQIVDPSMPDTDHVALPSGLFNFRTGEMTEHNPEVQTFYRLSEDPEFDSPTPRLDDFLGRVLPAEDHERFLDFLTAAILPGNPKNHVFLLVGDGGNGKSRALELLKALVPKAHRSAVTLGQLKTQFSAARMYGKVLNICGDISSKHLSDTETFKLVSGGDDVTVERKGVDATEAPIWAKMVFSANQIPTCSDTTTGYFRRWVVFEFPNKLEWSEAQEAALHAEAPAIIGMLLRRAVANGYEVRQTDAGQQAFGKLRLETDVAAQWWDETSLRDGEFLDRTEAFADYVAWAEASKRSVMSNREFFRRLRLLFGITEVQTTGGVRGWLIKKVLVDPQPTEVVGDQQKTNRSTNKSVGEFPQVKAEIEPQPTEQTLFSQTTTYMSGHPAPLPAFGQHVEPPTAPTERVPLWA